jgi:quercetin dioxygenase-like cupin family protein
MPGPTVIPPGAGEVIGDTPQRRIELLCEQDALHATSVRMAARGEGADLHVHRRHSDLFYVLEGELTVRLSPAGEPVAAPAGTLARIPPLVVHGYRNASDAEARFLNLHAPGSGFAAYLRALRDGRRHTFDQEPPVAVAEVALEAGTRPPEADGDRGRVQAAYVLVGALDVDLAGRRVRAEAGAWVTLPPGVAPALSASAAARYLSIRAPGG